MERTGNNYNARRGVMKPLLVVLGVTLSLGGAQTSEIQVPSTSPEANSSAPEQSVCRNSEEGVDSAEHSSGSAQPMAGNTCADMGWYEASEYDACNDACGHTCVRKQWCGTGPCQPWPGYCWKCS